VTVNLFEHEYQIFSFFQYINILFLKVLFYHPLQTHGHSSIDDESSPTVEKGFIGWPTSQRDDALLTQCSSLLCLCVATGKRQPYRRAPARPGPSSTGLRPPPGPLPVPLESALNAHRALDH